MLDVMMAVVNLCWPVLMGMAFVVVVATINQGTHHDMGKKSF